MIYLEKFGRAEEKTKFKWGIPLHWWLKAPCFRSQDLSATTSFLSPQLCGTQDPCLTLQNRTLCFPQCAGIQVSPAKRVSSQRRGDCSQNTDLSWAEAGQLLIISSTVHLYLENIIAGFVVRSEDTPSLANTVVWHLMTVRSQDCLSLLWKNSSSEISLRTCVSVKAEKENSHPNHRLIYWIWFSLGGSRRNRNRA